MMNKSILNNIFMFAAGAAIGTVVTWKLVKTKYEQIANEEIEEIREYYRSKDDSDRGTEHVETPATVNTRGQSGENECVDAVTYLKDKIDALGYNPAFGGEEVSAKDNLKPHVIPPEDFGDQGYDTVTLTIYADGVLTDDQENIIEDADEMLGEGSLDRFGEFEDDALHVRDDNNRIDYEILADSRESSEVFIR